MGEYSQDPLKKKKDPPLSYLQGKIHFSLLHGSYRNLFPVKEKEIPMEISQVCGEGLSLTKATYEEICFHFYSHRTIKTLSIIVNRRKQRGTVNSVV